jgi:Glycosyl hydrolase catalytic core/Carbohydrate binding module (family 6)/Secretion system C-terminal sorting domain
MNKTILIFILFLLSVHALSQNGRSQKRGIAYGHHSEADMSAISGGLSWWYNWYHQPEAGVANVYQNYDMDFVPMTWNNSFNETALRAYYASHPEAKYLLAFNEPNFTAQANMRPSQVAAAWPRLEAIAADYNLKIVGPAVNWCGECVSEGGVKFTNPYTYLDSFFSVCPHCRVDYIAVHNYMCYTSALSSYLEGFKKYRKKIWLTEYACWDQNNITLAMQKNLMKGSIDYLENDTMIFRYSWFTGNRSGAYPYLDIYAPQPGKLTELGKFYVSYKANIHDTSYYSPVPVRIEAENYSAMSGIFTEAVSDFDGIDDVGWIDAGDWLEYNIEVLSAASYYIYFRVAALSNTSIIIKVDGKNTDTLKVSPTGGWQNWKTLGIQTDLPAGKHKFMVFAPKGGFNLNWLRISDHTNTPPTIDAGADQIITLPENTAILAGSGNDTDKDMLQYSWRKISGPTSSEITGPNSASTDVTGLVQGKYIFEVVISDGTETASDQVVVEVVFATGLEDAKFDAFIVYPNPAENLLYFKTTGFSGKNEFILTDPLGRVHVLKSFPGGNDLFELDISSVQPGYYILKVIRESGTTNYPIIKL